MMRGMRVLRLFPCLFVFLMAGPAQAAWLDWVIPPPKPDFERPYLRDGKAPHYTRWMDDQWNPQSWVSARGSKEAVMQGLYNAKILRDDDAEAGDDSIDVGFGFMRLSDTDKMHVVRFVYETYGLNQGGAPVLINYSGHPCPVFGETIGLITPEGVQLQ